MSVPFYVHRVDHLQAWHSAPPLPASSSEMTRICFGCFFCVVSVSPCPSLFACVDVAVFLTLLATIRRRVPELGCWVDEGLQWKALPPESAEKVEPEPPSTCW